MIRWVLRMSAAVAAVSMIVSVSPPTDAQHWDAHRSDWVRDSWIVELAPGVDPDESREIAQEHEGRAPNIYRSALAGFAFRGSEAQAQELASDPRVRLVEPDLRVQVARKWQGDQKRLRVHRAYRRGHTGDGARVAIIDTGVGPHPFFDGRIDRRRGRACAPGDDTFDQSGHGTRTAGNLLRVAPGATIVPIRVFPHNSLSTSLSRVMCGVDHVTKLNTERGKRARIDVANLSLAAPGTCSQARSFCEAIKESLRSGAVYTVAAGNATANAGGYLPASHPGVIAVSALAGDWAKGLAWFSNYGSVVDMTAPGVDILSPVPGGGWTRTSGTSRSAPLVGGVAAIVKSYLPNWMPFKIKRHLLKTGRCPNGNTNRRDGPCQGKGTWNNDPDGVAEPVPDAVRAGRRAKKLS